MLIGHRCKRRRELALHRGPRIARKSPGMDSSSENLRESLSPPAGREVASGREDAPWGTGRADTVPRISPRRSERSSGARVGGPVPAKESLELPLGVRPQRREGRHELPAPSGLAADRRLSWTTASRPNLASGIRPFSTFRSRDPSSVQGSRAARRSASSRLSRACPLPQLFGAVGLVSLIAAAILVVLAKPIRELMSGVR
jgi:hypothetical protein